MRTEDRNPDTMNLSEMSAQEVVDVMNRYDETIAEKVRASRKEIAEAAELYARVIRNGDRVFYLGAGTSGGLALLDAAEVPPTFGLKEGTVIALTAEDGIRYLSDDEDDPEKAVSKLKEHGCNENDFVIGVAASGSTPYVLAGMKYARSLGAKTAAIVCNENTPMEEAADLTMKALTGAEVLTGSTRLRAGTAEKMILNMLSTAAMVLLGMTWSNLMVNVIPMNEKLVRRAVSIITQAAQCNEEEAEAALSETEGSVRKAIVSLIESKEK